MTGLGNREGQKTKSQKSYTALVARCHIRCVPGRFELRREGPSDYAVAYIPPDSYSDSAMDA